MREEDENHSAIGDVAGFVRAVVRRDTRGPELRRVGGLVGKWLLAGAALSALAAAGEIHALGFAGAWERYGTWWLLVPAMVGSAPIAFVLSIAVLEVAAYAVAVPIVLPSLLLGDRWMTVLRRGAAIVALGFVGWLVWQEGYRSATENVQRPARGNAATVAPRAPAGDGDPGVLAWLRSNAIAVMVGTVIGGVAMKSLDTVTSEWIKRKFFGPRTAVPTVKLYGPDERVVSEVELERKK